MERRMNARSIGRGGAAATLIATALLITTATDTALARPQVVLIAGDIAHGTTTSQEAATADLVERYSGLVMTAGDNAYPHGSHNDFRTKYEPTWGRFLSRTRPTPGNQDYQTPGAAGYFEYFGSRAGPRSSNGRGRGYYSFKVGRWLVLALDSEACVRREGCRRGSPEHRWLSRTLANSGARCTLAVWHRPPWSSGAAGQGDDDRMRPLQRLLYRHGAELLVTGHAHNYERLAPARPDGTVDLRFGIRQFVVGTGGADLLPAAGRIPLRRAPQSPPHGRRRLTLRWGRYHWEFLPIAGQSYDDTGSGRCHGKP
jgi:hypothetical protein